MRRSAFFLLCVCALAAAADIDERIIPKSPRTQEEIDATTKVWRERGYNDATIDLLLKDPRNTTTYRDADIRQAFPEVPANAQQAYFCTNRLMSDATDVAYWSRLKSPHQVRVTQIACTAGEAGLSCRSLRTIRATFLEDPKQFFTLEDDISLEEAREVLGRLDAYGFAGADPWFGDLKSKDVRALGRSGNAIRLNFGESLVCGCMLSVSVQLEQAYAGHPDQRLRVVGKPEGGCV